jgi:hypothetical protein
VALITQPHLALRLEKEKSYTSAPPLGLRGLFYGEHYLYLYLYNSHEQRQSILRTRISPTLLSTFVPAISAYAFALIVCTHAQLYLASGVALLPGHK